MRYPKGFGFMNPNGKAAKARKTVLDFLMAHKDVLWCHCYCHECEWLPDAPGETNHAFHGHLAEVEEG